jgi:multidrug resistance protein, MATE family
MLRSKTYLDNSYRNILRVSVPIMLGTFVEFLVVLADSSFLSRVGTNAFNASVLASFIYIALFMFGVGFSSGIQIVIARREGEGRYKLAGIVFFNALILILLLSGIMFLAVRFGFINILQHTLSDHGLYQSIREFLLIRVWGYPLAFTTLIFTAFYTGIAKTKILTAVMIILALSNIILDYLLIFGIGIFPELGLTGAAIASLSAEALAMVFIVIYTLGNKSLWEKYFLFRFRKVYGYLCKSLLKFSSPLMVQQFIAVSSWAIFFNLIEQVGSYELEVSSVVRSLYYLLFVPLMGLSTATRTFTSTLLAERRVSEIPVTLKRIIVISLIMTSGLLVLLLTFPSQIIGIVNPNEEIISGVVSVYQVIVGAVILFSFSSVVFNLVSGSGDTRMSLIIEASTIALYLGTAAYIILYHSPSVQQIWMTEYIYFGLLTIFSVGYYLSGRWRRG